VLPVSKGGHLVVGHFHPGAAMSGVDERPMSADVVSIARRIEPLVLRSLDALHLATAVLIDADLVVTYDDRLADACRRNALAVESPGRD